MVIYVQNNTAEDIKLPYKGEVYVFPTGAICSVDETVLPYENLLRFYGWNNGYPNIPLIVQPTPGQVGASIPALQIYFTVPSAINTLIKDSCGIEGDANKWRFDYLLFEQSLQNSTITTTPPIPIPILSGGTGIGNATLIVPSSTVFGIQNFGNDILNFTIGSINITVSSESSFEDTFNPFTSVNISTTSSYNWFTK